MADQNFACRKLAKEDIPACAQIVFEAFNAYSKEKNEPMIPDPAIVEGRLYEYEKDAVPGLLYGGFLGEEQVGFFMIRKLGIDEEAWEISMVGVLPEQQNRGYGRRMVEYAVSEVLAFKGVLAVCAVTEGNDKALKLFADQGFESEASGIPISETMSIWMLRKDMKNAMAKAAVEAEAAAEREVEEGTQEISISM